MFRKFIRIIYLNYLNVTKKSLPEMLECVIFLPFFILFIVGMKTNLMDYLKTLRLYFEINTKSLVQWW